MNDLRHLGVVFTSRALDSDAVRVLDIAGREQLGQLFEFRVRFALETGPLADAEIDQLLQTSCSFTLGRGPDDVVHGVVREVELVEGVEGRQTVYVATVVPSVWLLTLSRVSTVYQDMSVVDMATEILTSFGLTGERDFAIRVFGNLEKREFCVQYEESDWAFLQRWFEHEGLYYWFEHGAAGEKLVIADVNRASLPIPGDASLPYRDIAGLVRSEDSVLAWGGAKRRTAARVVLKEYSELNPSMPMTAHADADRARGFGVLFAYGEHFVTADAGKALAQKRGERCRTEQATPRGRTDCSRFRVGHTFTMWNHYVTDQNREYLLTAIDHHVGAIDPTQDNRAPGDDVEYGYRASFEALPSSTQYRPARTTPWPSIDGVMHAHVDSDTAGKFSTINGNGRYRVRLPFDSTGNKGERASNWVRMAQSYSGAGYGSHFPLHKGAEVILAFIGGDPDRPIIVGAVPNAHTPSPSVSRNATQSVIQSASGLRFVMEDVHAPPPSSRTAH
jgi:type VI secretion system secreted protein VgrG